MTELHRVVLFLHLMKAAAGECFVFVRRSENIATLTRLGITRQHAEALVVGLKPADYVKGPVPDHNNPGRDMWVFGLKEQGIEVYVKLQVTATPIRCVCVSFHEAKSPMDYPLRERPSPTNKEEKR